MPHLRITAKGHASGDGLLILASPGVHPVAKSQKADGIVTLPRSESLLIEDAVNEAMELSAHGKVFAGAAILHAELRRLLGLRAQGHPSADELVREAGQALAAYLLQHRLSTFAACRVGQYYSLDIRPVGQDELPGEGERILVTLVLGPDVRVVHGDGDEALVEHRMEGRGTLLTALAFGWASVLEDG